MSGEPKMFRINPENRESEAISEVEFARLGFQERRDIQEWIAANPGILGDDLLIIGKEFSGFDRTSERLDLLAVDSDGKLVIIEMKRDDTGADAHWQAIKYASYLRRASTDNIVAMLAGFANVGEDEAGQRLQEHLGVEDLNILNNDQRIILASHRFAPEVTSAALWLNEKAPDENLITCVQLVPYRDETTDSLYIQASTIIPLPGTEDYTIGVRDTSQQSRGSVVTSFGAKYSRTVARNRNDDMTRFLRRVSDVATDELPGDIKPDQRSRWAGQSKWGNAVSRSYKWWYSRAPWGRRDDGVSYRINVFQHEDGGEWSGVVEFYYGVNGLNDKVANLSVYDDQRRENNRVFVRRDSDSLNDDFAITLASVLRRFMEVITPLVDDFEDESNEEVQ